MNMNKAANFFIASIAVVIILIYGQSLLVPFVLGLLLWFVVRELKAAMDIIPFVRKKVPSWLKSTLSSIFILLVVGFLFEILSENIKSLTSSYEKYGANVDSMVAMINETFNLNIIEDIKGQSGDFNFGEILGAIFSSLSNIIGNTFMILLYALFVILEETNFQNKLKMLFPDEEQFEQFSTILNKIEKSISSYLGLKTLVSSITGVLSYIALRIIGVDSPEFWAFLIFVLNFIPTIGSLIGTLFPAFFSLLQFGEITPFLMILGFVGLIQVIVGNIIEPRLMGSSMNISPLVTILALSFWGVIWGVVGMLLSVPITVSMIIVCSQFESTKRIAILLSEKGIIERK
jgi:predicted PurR-regulated permease PerM